MLSNVFPRRLADRRNSNRIMAWVEKNKKTVLLYIKQRDERKAQARRLKELVDSKNITEDDLKLIASFL